MQIEIERRTLFKAAISEDGIAEFEYTRYFSRLIISHRYQLEDFLEEALEPLGMIVAPGIWSRTTRMEKINVDGQLWKHLPMRASKFRSLPEEIQRLVILRWRECKRLYGIELQWPVYAEEIREDESLDVQTSFQTWKERKEKERQFISDPLIFFTVVTRNDEYAQEGIRVVVAKWDEVH